MNIALAVALCLAVLAAPAVCCFALWTMWGVIKSQRAAMYDQQQAHQKLQARFLALELERHGSSATAAQALDQARPVAQQVHRDVFPPPPPESYDEIGELAGSLG